MSLSHRITTHSFVSVLVICFPMFSVVNGTIIILNQPHLHLLVLFKVFLLLSFPRVFALITVFYSHDSPFWKSPSVAPICPEPSVFPRFLCSALYHNGVFLYQSIQSFAPCWKSSHLISYGYILDPEQWRQNKNIIAKVVF